MERLINDDRWPNWQISIQPFPVATPVPPIVYPRPSERRANWAVRGFVALCVLVGLAAWAWGQP